MRFNGPAQNVPVLRQMAGLGSRLFMGQQAETAYKGSDDAVETGFPPCCPCLL